MLNINVMTELEVIKEYIEEALKRCDYDCFDYKFRIRLSRKFDKINAICSDVWGAYRLGFLSKTVAEEYVNELEDYKKKMERMARNTMEEHYGEYETDVRYWMYHNRCTREEAIAIVEYINE
jgi:hypothetical protein